MPVPIPAASEAISRNVSIKVLRDLGVSEERITQYIRTDVFGVRVIDPHYDQNARHDADIKSFVKNSIPL